MMQTRRMLALDTEDDGEGHCTIINLFDGHEHMTFMGEEDREWVWRYLESLGPVIIWACNMEYDLVNVYGSEWVGKMVTLTYVRSGFMRGSATHAPVLYYDTLRHWPATVEEMGRKLGLPKLERDFESVTYCRRDTEIVYYFVMAMLPRYQALGLTLKATLPAMALQLYHRLHHANGSDDMMVYPEFPVGIVEMFRRAYYGARTEVYKLGVTRGEIHHYDVNSLYPSVMFDQVYPELHTWRITHAPSFEREGVADCTIDLDRTDYPGLPMRGPAEIVFPWGRVCGVWTYPEIRRALADGASVSRVRSAIEFSGNVRPFRSYIAYCYARRRKAQEENDEIGNIVWKHFMNDLYGKFAQQDGLTMICRDKQFMLNTRGGSHVNVIWSAYVTAYGRLRLLELLRGCGDRGVYYTDTDSLFSPKVLPVSQELGSLKHVALYRELECVGNKLYRTDSNAHAKGVPKREAMEFIRTGQATYRKPARLRESRKGVIRANAWYEVTKHRRNKYLKRRVVEGDDGWTEPWEWSEYQRMAMRSMRA